MPFCHSKNLKIHIQKMATFDPSRHKTTRMDSAPAALGVHPPVAENVPQNWGLRPPTGAKRSDQKTLKLLEPISFP